MIIIFDEKNYLAITNRSLRVDSPVVRIFRWDTDGRGTVSAEADMTG